MMYVVWMCTRTWNGSVCCRQNCTVYSTVLYDCEDREDRARGRGVVLKPPCDVDALVVIKYCILELTTDSKKLVLNGTKITQTN